MFEEKEIMKSVFIEEMQLMNLGGIAIKELKKQGISGKVKTSLKRCS
jgi:hypothetical protein